MWVTEIIVVSMENKIKLILFLMDMKNLLLLPLFQGPFIVFFFLTKINLGETELNYHKSNMNARVGMIWNFWMGQCLPIKKKKEDSNKDYNNILLTHSRRYSFSSSKLESALGLPLTISKATTPKENTSTFSVRCPRIAYSGARYPLKQ